MGKKVLYYLSAFDRKFVENRTADHEVLVVKSRSECAKGVPLASSLASASVAVFPGVPAGFAAAGIGTATAVAAVAGGAAVVGGGVALAVTKSNHNSNPPPTTVAAVTTTLPGITTTTTTTTTTQPTALFSPIFNVIVQGSLIPADQTLVNFILPCPEPVEFDMCPSTGPYKLAFSLNITSNTGPGDPSTGAWSGRCDLKGMLAGSGGFGFMSRGVAAQAAPLPAIYNATMNIESAAPGNKPKASRAVTFVFQPTSPACAASASDLTRASATRRRFTWVSQLEVPEGSGQVVINGLTAIFAGGGRSTALAESRGGENRVEAELVSAAGGRPGTWAFELGPGSGRLAGSLRVLAGTVALITDDRVVFRLSGRAGERVVFTFRSELN